MAELLRELARSPDQLARYTAMSLEQKEAFLAEKVSKWLVLVETAALRSPGLHGRWDGVQVSRRPTVDEFLAEPRCSELLDDYRPLVAAQLAPWKVGAVPAADTQTQKESTAWNQSCHDMAAAETGCVALLLQGNLTVERVRSLQRHPSATLYIKHGRMFLEGDESDLGHPMTVLWADYLHGLVQEVASAKLHAKLHAEARLVFHFVAAQESKTLVDLASRKHSLLTPAP